MKEESAEKKAREAAKYAEKQHRYRAKMVAQTELAKAYNYGAEIEAPKIIPSATPREVEFLEIQNVDTLSETVQGNLVTYISSMILRKGKRFTNCLMSWRKR